MANNVPEGSGRFISAASVRSFLLLWRCHLAVEVASLMAAPLFLPWAPYFAEHLARNAYGLFTSQSVA